MSTAFLLTTLVVVATPGTGALYTIAAGLARGTRQALVAATGATLGTVPHLAAAITGLAALLHASGVAYEVLRYLGVAYLLYMAASAIRDKRPLHVPAAEPKPAARVIAQGVLINLLNPKLTLFFFAFLPQFATGTGRMLGLGGIFMAVTFVVFAGYGALAAALRDRVVDRPRVTVWMRRAFGATFAALAGRLALER